MQLEEILLESVNTVKNFIERNPSWVVIIRWATATWKTKLSIMLSDFFDIEVISCDSRQFFCKMNIWTDKIPQEVRKKIPHHQIDIVDPSENYTAGQRKKDTENLVFQIQKKWKIPFIVWWTGLYIDTIYKNYSLPESKPNRDFREKMFANENQEPWFLHKKLISIDPIEAEKIHPKSTRYIVRALEIFEQTWQTKSTICKEQPVKNPLLMIWLRRDKESTNSLIDHRVEEMISNWLIQEVDKLIKEWYSKELQSMQWIWYKETTKYLEWKINKEELKQEIKQNTYRLAKKQRTRFRRYIKDSQENPKENVEYKIFQL